MYSSLEILPFLFMSYLLKIFFNLESNCMNLSLRILVKKRREALSSCVPSCFSP